MIVEIETKNGSLIPFTKVEGWNFHFAEGWLEIIEPERVTFIALDNLTNVVVPNTWVPEVDE